MIITRNSLVSVITPAYNAQRYIKRAIESVLNQTYKNLEVIVIDDGSTDRTAEIIKSYNDPRIIYLYQENQGQGPARNYGIRKSKGEYITLLDADDVYLPEKIEKQVQFMQTYPEYKAVYCNALHFYSDNPYKFFKKKYDCPCGDIFPDLLRTSLINPNTIMFHREVLEKVGGFNEKRYYPEDWDMWLRIARACFRFGYIDEDLVKVEIREDSNTTMDIQWILKENALEMFHNIFSQMTKEEKSFYRTDKILKKMRFKLAIAYLIAERKRDFLHTFSRLCPSSFFGKIIGIILLAVPSSVLVKLWRRNQFRGLFLVNKENASF